jgi:TolB-like protein/DNA-binding SARP family transcriptional activator
LASAFVEAAMSAASALQNGNDGPARWSLRLFGDFQLSEGTSGEKVALPGKRERVLLAYLALSPNGRQPRRKLVTLLWGEAADETTLDNLRTAVFNLRKALGDTDRRIIASEDRDIVLDSSLFEVDVLTFRRLAAASGVAELEEAAKLYAGDFLEGLSIESEEFESWRREESARCKGQALDVLTRLMAQLAASGESERAIETGLRILRLEPLHETAVRHLMRLYAGSDRRAGAVDLYRTLAESLKKELGAQPEAETRAVYAEVTRGGEGPTAPVGEVRSPPSTIIARGTSSAAEPSFRASSSTPVALQTANRRSIAWVAGGLAGAAALAMLLFVAFAPSLGPEPTGQPATVVAATPTSAVALAVLPFANLSADAQQEFFSDGLTDEITSALARIPDLGVVARTSAYQFKGQNRDLRAVGQSLGATHLIEGSVRKAGDQVRITAQLIQADNGLHIWTATYDRNLTDIFAIQEEIARAIAASLRMPLGVGQDENLVSNRAIDPDSYQQYLRAKGLVSLRARGVPQAIEILEPLVARNPDYAPAWALLASAYGLTPNFARSRPLPEMRQVVADTQPKAEAAAQRAIALDPSLAEGHLALSRVYAARGNFLMADELRRKALALDPNHPDALQAHSNWLATAGRLKEALGFKQHLWSLEPLIPGYNVDLAEFFWVDGQTDRAIAILKETSLGNAKVGLATIYASQGRYNEAAEVLLAMPAGPAQPPREALEEAARLLRTAPVAVASPQGLPTLGGLAFIYLHIGAPGRILEPYEGWRDAGYITDIGFPFFWHPSYAPVRKLERFKAYVRKAGFVDYWRAKGWPDLCRPVGADDFECG